MNANSDDVTNESKAPALSTDNLSFSYGANKALDGATLTVPQGRFVCLLGANGAGKTTLFSIISGLYAAQSGSVQIMGHDLVRQTLLALKSIGIVFQRPTLDMDLTVVQNLRYYASLQGISKSDSRTRIDAAIDRHRLNGLQGRKAGGLSGGQRRRVELARALLHDPKLLLLDEPTVGLDLKSRIEFVAHVRELCDSGSTGVLWATHLVDEVTDQDKAIVLDHGKVIETGQVSQLRTKYQAEDVAQMFNECLAQSENKNAEADSA